MKQETWKFHIYGIRNGILHFFNKKKRKKFNHKHLWLLLDNVYGIDPPSVKSATMSKFYFSLIKDVYICM